MWYVNTTTSFWRLSPFGGGLSLWGCFLLSLVPQPRTSCSEHGGGDPGCREGTLSSGLDQDGPAQNYLRALNQQLWTLSVGRRCNCRDSPPFPGLCTPSGLLPSPQLPKPPSFSSLQYSQAPCAMLSLLQALLFILNLQLWQHWDSPKLMTEPRGRSLPCQDTGQAESVAGAHLPPGEPSVVLIQAEGLCPSLREGTGSFPHLLVFWVIPPEKSGWEQAWACVPAALSPQTLQLPLCRQTPGCPSSDSLSLLPRLPAAPHVAHSSWFHPAPPLHLLLSDSTSKSSVFNTGHLSIMKYGSCTASLPGNLK